MEDALHLQTLQHKRRLPPLLCHVLAELRKVLSADQNVLTAADRERACLAVMRGLGVELTNYERDLVLNEIEKELRPFGILQDLVNTPAISDIIVSNHATISAQVSRKNQRTALTFSDQEAYEVFVERLLLLAATSYSTKKPIADGVIGGFARVHAVHKSLCESGPYLTIRLNRFSTVQLEDLKHCGLAPAELLDYLRGIVRLGRTILLVGEVGSGKTTLARALAGAIPQHEAILVIEDTPEIRLVHPHVRYLTTRDNNIEGAGQVTPSECIRAGMRMGMNRIIFGEIRDGTAAEALIDVCSSGHPGVSTIHGRSIADALTRLELFLARAQAGVDRQTLKEQIATAVQVLVHLDVCKTTGRRRIMRVQEIGPFADGVIRERSLFRYDLKQQMPGWLVENRTSAFREQLEALDNPVMLSRFAPRLEPDVDVLYREVTTGAAACA